jgi:hypothetical protein
MFWTCTTIPTGFTAVVTFRSDNHQERAINSSTVLKMADNEVDPVPRGDRSFIARHLTILSTTVIAFGG